MFPNYFAEKPSYFSRINPQSIPLSTRATVRASHLLGGARRGGGCRPPRARPRSSAAPPRARSILEAPSRCAPVVLAATPVRHPHKTTRAARRRPGVAGRGSGVGGRAETTSEMSPVELCTVCLEDVRGMAATLPWPVLPRVPQWVLAMCSPGSPHTASA